MMTLYFYLFELRGQLDTQDPRCGRAPGLPTGTIRCRSRPQQKYLLRRSSLEELED